MKVILVCDNLLERNAATPILELWADLFPDSPLYTLAHQVGKVLGPLEQRKITSTFLSRFCKTHQDFKKLSFLAPGAMKSLVIPADTNLVLSVSQGFAHHIEIPKNTLHFSYLYSFTAIEGSLSLPMRLFKSFINQWQKKKFEHIDYLWVSSKFLKDQIPFPSHVLYPFFKYSDYANVSFSQEEKKYYIVRSCDLNQHELALLKAAANKCKVELFFVDEDHCAGDWAYFFSQAKAFLDFSQGPSYPLALAALYCQTPLALRELPLTIELFDQSLGPKISHFSEENLIVLFKQLEGFYSHFPKNKLMARALQNTETRFAEETKKIIEGWNKIQKLRNYADRKDEIRL